MGVSSSRAGSAVLLLLLLLAGAVGAPAKKDPGPGPGATPAPDLGLAPWWTIPAEICPVLAPATFAGWWRGEAADPEDAGRLLSAFELAAEAEIGEGRIRFSDLAARIGASRIDGDFAWRVQTDGRRVLGTDFTADRIDLVQLRAMAELLGFGEISGDRLFADDYHIRLATDEFATRDLTVRDVVVDAAYTEFAEEDLTPFALQWKNAVVIRTLSKAWGLAGLRVGYALGSPEVIAWLRSAGAPYPVSGPSLAIAEARVQEGERDMQAFVTRVRFERERLEATLASLGARVTNSQGNFAFARLPDPLWLRDGLAGLGIAIRAFPGAPGLEDAVRIACPGDPASFDRLLDAMQTLFDMETDR